MNPIVECKDLSKAYRGQIVLREINFCLGPGEALLVTGPNGSGKTTLISILAGLLAGDGGEVKLLGETLNPNNHRLRHKIGFAPPSESTLFLNATVRENLGFWARLQGVEGETPIDEVAKRWDFTPYLDRAARELSSGYRRRVALARAFLHRPRVVLLDEPFAFLDTENQEHTLQALEAWLKDLGGSLIVSSNFDFLRGSTWKTLDMRSISRRERAP